MLVVALSTLGQLLALRQANFVANFDAKVFPGQYDAAA